MGSVIALEMAAQLAKMGRPVHQLALIDPTLPLTKAWLWVSLDPSHPISKALVRHLPRSLFPIWKALPRYVPRFLHELRFRPVLKRERLEGRESYSEFRLSLIAQAKLLAAYLGYEPPPFHGPVAILLSWLGRATVYPYAGVWAALAPRRRITSSTAARIAILLPQQRVHVFEGDHEGVSGSVPAARLLQSIFDADLVDC